MPSCIVCGKFFESKRKLSGHYTWCSGKRKPKYGIENPCFGRIFSEETIKKYLLVEVVYIHLVKLEKRCENHKKIDGLKKKRKNIE